MTVSFDVHHTKKGSGCSGTTGRSAERLPFLVAVPTRGITSGGGIQKQRENFLLQGQLWFSTKDHSRQTKDTVNYCVLKVKVKFLC